MATYQAIAAVGQAIIGLLEDAWPRQEFANAQFALYQPADMARTSPLSPLSVRRGITLYLYRVAVNGAQRNRPPRLGSDGKRLRASLPVDLYYLMSAWAESAVLQQRLLGWAMRTLEDTLILPAGLLNRPGPERNIFRPTETVELSWEPLSLQDLVNIWDPFKQNFQPSVAFMARVVSLDSLDSAEVSVEAEPVQTRELGFGVPDQNQEMGFDRTRAAP